MKIKKANTEILEGDMTPMIDMSFQLIAFLMVLVNFNAEEVSAKVVLPQSELAKPPTGNPPPNRIVIQITKTGTVIMGAEEMGMDGLRNMLGAEEYVLRSKGVELNEATIYIRAHQDCPTGKVQDVIKECQLKKFENFVLRAKEPQNK